MMTDTPFCYELNRKKSLSNFFQAGFYSRIKFFTEKKTLKTCIEKWNKIFSADIETVSFYIG